MYNLDVRQLSDGILNYTSNSGQIKTVYTNQSLDTGDCYSIALNTYLNHDYSWAVRWLNVAIDKANKNDLDMRHTILELLSKSFYKLGEKSKAFDYLKESLTVLSDKELGIGSINEIKNILVSSIASLHKNYESGITNGVYRMGMGKWDQQKSPYLR